MKPVRSLLSLLAILPVLASAREPADFRLDPADVPKVVVFLFKPDRAILEVTYSKEKQAELTALSTAKLRQPVVISIGDSFFFERTFTAPATGHSIKFDVPTQSEAQFLARILMETPASAPLSPPQPSVGAGLSQP